MCPKSENMSACFKADFECQPDKGGNTRNGHRKESHDRQQSGPSQIAIGVTLQELRPRQSEICISGALSKGSWGCRLPQPAVRSRYVCSYVEYLCVRLRATWSHAAFYRCQPFPRPVWQTPKVAFVFNHDVARLTTCPGSIMTLPVMHNPMPPSAQASYK